MKSSFRFMSSLFALLFMSTPDVRAQASADNSLPNPTQITIQDKQIIINGGTHRGKNLFHSFSNFSVPTDHLMQFNNPNTIQNIITRVTGNYPSEIFGSLRANGNANLFLINPNGILFGPNARLNIGGSFIASTAKTLKFADGSTYETTPRKQSALLSDSIPTELGFAGNPKPITVMGFGNNVQTPNFQPVTRSSKDLGLQVKPGKTLALLGGNVFFKGGIASADQGKIVVGGIVNGQVGLHLATQGWSFGYSGVTQFGNVTLSGASLLDASGISPNSGSIQVVGHQVSLRDGSLLLIQGLGGSGTIEVNATDSVTITGSTASRSIDSALWSETLGSESGSDIIMTTPQLVVDNFGQIVATSLGLGSAGSIDLDISQQVQISTGGLISTLTLGSQGGDIRLTTDRLLMNTGGTILTGTFSPPFSPVTGGSGNIFIRANLIELSGFSAPFSTLTAISSGTFSDGSGGSVVIYTDKLRIFGGARVDSSTTSSGSSGNVFISASESILVDGNDSLIIASGNLVSPELQELFRAPPLPTGNSGSISLNSPQITVRNGGELSVRNDGTGNAGELKITANTIDLNRGTISATTQGGNGGILNLSAKNLLFLDQGQISTTAIGQGTGGNINIDSGLIVSRNGSTISANAQQAQAGQIIIDTRGLFTSADSFITSTSELGTLFNGLIQINTSQVSLAAESLPTVIPPQAPLVSSVCRNADSTISSFRNTGTGGSPTSTDQLPGNRKLWQDTEVSQTLPPNQSNPPKPALDDPDLVEAVGWKDNGDGTISYISATEQKQISMLNQLPPCP